MFSFAQIVDYCLSAGPGGGPVKWLLICGDVNDAPEFDMFVSFFLRHQFDRLEAAGVRVYFVQGQHDMVAGLSQDRIRIMSSSFELRHTPSTLLEVYQWPRWIHGQELLLAGKICYGLDYLPPDKVKDGLASVPKSSEVLLTHQVFREFVGSAAVSTEDVPPHVRLVVTGDYHATINKTFPTGVRVISPGSSCLQAIDETGAKYCIGVREGWEVEWLPLRTRGLMTVNVGRDHIDLIKANADLDMFYYIGSKIWSDFPEPVRKPIVRINVRHRSGILRAEELEQRLANSAHVIRTPKWDDLPELSPDEPAPLPARVLTLHEAADAVCARNGFPELSPTVKRILDSANPVAEVDSVVTDSLKGAAVAATSTFAGA